MEVSDDLHVLYLEYPRRLKVYPTAINSGVPCMISWDQQVTVALVNSSGKASTAVSNFMAFVLLLYA